jgi:hypothetical protein
MEKVSWGKRYGKKEIGKKEIGKERWESRDGKIEMKKEMEKDISGMGR